MPVIVIGADTPVGNAVVSALKPKSGEIRVFVSDPDAAARYRTIAKVAIGDLSDGSHVGGAAIGAFCAIAIAEAAHASRERYFADTPEAIFDQWADGLADAGVGRIIFIGATRDTAAATTLRSAAAEFMFVETTDKSPKSIAAEVARVEAAT